MKINLRDVKILCERFKSVSLETPRRIDTILVEQVEGEDLVDKIAALGFSPFFTSYVYKV